MRRKHFLVGSAIFLLGPSVAACQTMPLRESAVVRSETIPAPDSGCTFPSPIDTVSWSSIQAHLQHLDSVGAFDTNPLVSDRQSLVTRLHPGKQARSMALVAGRPAVRGTPDDRLERGCFVGMIDSENAEPEVGAFEGKTFVWVDMNGPGGTWRSLQFPLDGQSRLDDATRIEMPYLITDSTGAGAFTTPPPTAHYVYRGKLYRSSIDSYDFIGARWMIRPPSPLPFPPLGAGFASLDAILSWMPMEVMACYRCDNTTCCPDQFELAVF